MLRADQLVKTFDRGATVAVPGVSLALGPGQRVGLTGPSGCGKSTLAAMLSLLLAPDHGTVEVGDEKVTRFGIRAPAQLRRRVQLLWQSPVAAADPRMRLRALITEPATVTGADPDTLLPTLAERVGLPDELLDRLPHEVSAGQLQRACIARALACQPQYLIADEPTAMLDASSQAAILHVLAEAGEADRLGILLITHDTELARHWCHDVVSFDELSSTPTAS